ncbi:MAG TPA: MBL fold metallo-hydrolase [Candidatus Dormibacteraeota bacterium]|jgi:ribonuclease BN (tRNA processing enzyme)|nr:MBL fold metallo-hydrolase [Candidatus Dormibacteraeota bacterium]
MRLTVLGSGSAFSGVGHNASYCVDGRLLVDCGSPAQLLLPEAGMQLQSVEAILVTHFHADHSAMLPVVLGARALTTDNPPPLRLAGPPGTREYVSRLVHTGYGGHLHGLIFDRLGLETTVLQDGAEADVCGYRVRAHAVVHSMGPSLAYSVQDSHGASVGFSGDSTLCAGLRRAIAQSQLMVCECTGWDRPVPSHLWWGEVSELIDAHPATRFVLSHLVERRQVRGALLAHDLLTLDVQAPGVALPEAPESVRAARQGE